MSASPVRVRPMDVDLPTLSVAFARRLQAAGIAVPAERPARFVEAIALVAPESRRRLYFTARAAFVADLTEVAAFNRVFAEIFGTHGVSEEVTDEEDIAAGPSRSDAPPLTRSWERPHGLGAGADRTATASRGTSGREATEEMAIPVLASDEELLSHKRFDALDPAERLELRRLMARLAVGTPTRLARRMRHDDHGRRIDLRRTLRGSLHTGGDPIRLARRRRRPVPRRLVLLCDISGSMEPYARVYLQFLACAAAGGGAGARRHEAFAFATRLTRLTRALHSQDPDRAIQRAASAAPDWSSGTRIGAALKSFNDRYGRRGMARGAVVVILSDGWERGDPALVGQQMERLARLAHRIVWVNPRAAARGFQPRAGGMAAALPHVDALLSGESLAALGEVVDAIGIRFSGAEPLPGSGWTLPEPEPSEAEEPWGSATPVAGSSVAMPSGFSPSRGHTTPGWAINDTAGRGDE